MATWFRNVRDRRLSEGLPTVQRRDDADGVSARDNWPLDGNSGLSCTWSASSCSGMLIVHGYIPQRGAGCKPVVTPRRQSDGTKHEAANKE